MYGENSPTLGMDSVLRLLAQIHPHLDELVPDDDRDGLERPCWHSACRTNPRCRPVSSTVFAEQSWSVDSQVRTVVESSGYQ